MSAECEVEGCSRSAYSKGYCNPHYQRWKRKGDVQADRPVAPRKVVCKIDGCGNPARGRGWCQKHYERWRRTGDALWEPTPKVHQPRMDSQGYMTVWQPEEKRYAHQHRLVMEALLGRPILPEENVHHKNGVRHDNRPENLELWVTSQPSGQRVQDKVDFAVEVLQRYAPSLLASSVAGGGATVGVVASPAASPLAETTP